MEAVHEVMSPEAQSDLCSLAVKKMQKMLNQGKERMRILAMQKDGEYCDHEVRTLLNLIDGKSC